MGAKSWGQEGHERNRRRRDNREKGVIGQKGEERDKRFALLNPTGNRLRGGRNGDNQN